MESFSESAWADELAKQLAEICDHVETELSAADFANMHADYSELYQLGYLVILGRPLRDQKLLSAFELGWVVSKVLSPSTVVIQDTTAHGRQREKVVNVDLIKKSSALPR